MQKNTDLPPDFILVIFRAFCDPKLLGSIEGDLIELYHARIKTSGKRKANIRMLLDVVLLFRPGIIRPLGFSSNLNHTIMFRNYFKVGFRNILKYRTFSFINIFGLALAMSVSMLILTMLADQNRYDQFHEKKGRIYRILSDYEGSKSPYATSPQPLARTLKDYPTIEATTHLIPGIGGDATNEEKTQEIRGYFAEPSFFSIFSFELESGNSGTALSAPYSMVISKEVANKLFGDQNPVGKSLQFEDRKLPFPLGGDAPGIPSVDWGDFIVTGVIDESRYDSHLAFDVLVSGSTIPSLITSEKMEDRRENWKWFYQTYTYALLREDQSPDDLSIALNDIVSSKETEIKSEYNSGFKLIPQALSDVALGLSNNDTNNRLPLIGYYFLAILALVILASACLNYTSLSIARALTRAKEIGIRKVTGALRTNLIVQFLSESILTALLSLVVAMVLLLALIPSFKGLWVNQYLNFELPFMPSLYLGFLLLAIVIGVLAGLYPAFLLSGYHPMKALKSLTEVGPGKLGLRKVLGISQFVVSLFFITTSILIYNQFKHYLTFDYGFQTESIVNIPLQGMDYQKFSAEIERIPGISTISACDIIPATGTNNNNEVKIMGSSEEFQSVGVLNIDRNFPANLGIALIAGNGFAISDQTATTQILVNEAMVKNLGYANAEAIVGEKFETKWGEQVLEIAGVVRDFRYKLLLNEDAISPLMLRYSPSHFQYANVKISSPDPMKTLSDLEHRWKELDPVHPFRYEFMDEELESTHQGIFDVVSILGFISFLAIFIACLGLLGMTIYTAERRTKEVGIRKFLGAGNFNIALLLSKGFLQMLVIAILLGAPLSYFINKLWLENFPNRVEFGVGTVVLGSSVLLLFGILTISSQTLRVSKAKVIDTLKMD
ncbi:ABC transporter permease [Algoriphagus sp. C2-6-M1]|uniref:ABC transporter permease n=1 Tax=Algoriphagus persicinus TaxID=3108754 RepID=UPI002B37AC0F|nr:ABC transporter permease [Algoriphagus sp. C2-6-M1]MEB2782810.1 ABC transporter permease [Algoriphagus sp. C2-6-M1]